MIQLFDKNLRKPVSHNGRYLKSRPNPLECTPPGLGLELKMVVVKAYCFHLRKASSHTRARWSLPHLCQATLKFRNTRQCSIDNKNLQHYEVLLSLYLINKSLQKIKGKCRLFLEPAPLPPFLRVFRPILLWVINLLSLESIYVSTDFNQRSL